MRSVIEREYVVGLLHEAIHSLERLGRAEKGLQDEEAEAMLSLKLEVNVLERAIQDVLQGVKA